MRRNFVRLRVILKIRRERHPRKNERRAIYSRKSAMTNVTRED